MKTSASGGRFMPEGSEMPGSGLDSPAPTIPSTFETQKKAKSFPLMSPLCRLLNGREECNSFNAREVRCYCNQPKCVPQGYMCRGKKCFTELPTPSRANTPLSQAGHSTHSGCLDESFKHRQCPAGFLCCDQDLCNHVDSPAMRNRLNKTLQVLISGQGAYLAPLQPNNHGSQTTDSLFTTTTATIIVAICGFVVMLLIASLAVRWLRPVPVQTTNKFVPHRTPDNGPPLLGPPKVPLV
ncbi:hypothetical protein HN011_003225 [Eciton burchellii]|nr:hypothetical protein HN011_003225 [Eciton burchellii]